MTKNKMVDIDVDIEHFDNGATVFSNVWLEDTIDYDFAMYLLNEISEKGKQTDHRVGCQEVSFWSDSENKRFLIDFRCNNSEAREFKEYFESEEFEKLVNNAIESFEKIEEK